MATIFLSKLKRAFPFVAILFPSTFFLYLPVSAQTPVQAPVGVKSQTATVSQTITETQGNTTIIGVSFCESGCGVSPKNDVVAVSDSNGDTCTMLAAGIRANESGSLWRCNIGVSGPNTVTAVVTGNSGTVHNAIQLSEWFTLPPSFAMAVGCSCTVSGFTLINGYNGSSVTAAGSGSPTFSPTPAGGIVLFNFAPPPPPPVIDTLTFSVQLVNCTKCDGTDYAPLASASVYQGASFLISQDTSQVCKATFDANAQASCSGGINVAPQFVNLTPTVTTASSSFVGPTASFPSLLAQGAVTGNVKLIIGFDASTMVPRAVQVYTQ